MRNSDLSILIKTRVHSASCRICRTIGHGTEYTVAGPAAAVLYTVYGQPCTALLSRLKYKMVPPSGAGHAAISESRMWSEEGDKRRVSTGETRHDNGEDRLECFLKIDYFCYISEGIHGGLSQSAATVHIRVSSKVKIQMFLNAKLPK